MVNTGAMDAAYSLQQLAEQALRHHYGITTAQLGLVASHSFNTVFRVDAANGSSVLRVGAAERIHPPGVEDLEAAWLDALSETGITTLANLASSDGSRWITASHPHVVGERVVTRFTWVEGVELRTQFDTAWAARAGRLLADLHAHASASPVEDVPASVHARSAIYLGERDLVAEVAGEHRSAFREATDRVQSHLDLLWSGDNKPHLLHGDFGPHNLLIGEDQLQVIDFQDLRLGFAEQDLGLTIADLARNTPQFITPFLQGYATHRQLPDLSPDIRSTLAAARSLNIMNLALQSPASGIGGLFDRDAHHVLAWVRRQT